MSHIPRPGAIGLPASDTAGGILLMIGTMLFFSIMDAFAKELSGRVGVPTTLWARYAGQTMVVFVLVLPRLRAVLRTRYPKLQLLRSMSLFAATACFFTGLSRVGLAENTAIMDLNGADHAGRGAVSGRANRAATHVRRGRGADRRIDHHRPGTEVFSPSAVFPLGAAVFFSTYTLITRFVGRDEDAWTSLFYTACFGAVVMTALMPYYGQLPTDALSIMLILAIGGIAAVGQLMLIRALQITQAGVLAPFTYCGLLFATLWGALIFGEYPDTATVIGGTIIVVSGLYVWYRETWVRNS